LTAEQFASEYGLKATTLKYMKYRLARERAETGITRDSGTVPAMIEVRAAAGALGQAFELDLGGRRLRIPNNFDPLTLKRLLDILERKP
jgi:hypothetical protein